VSTPFATSQNPFVADIRNMLTTGVPSFQPMSREDMLWYLSQSDMSTVEAINPRAIYNNEDRLDYCIRVGVVQENADGTFQKKLVVTTQKFHADDDTGDGVEMHEVADYIEQRRKIERERDPKLRQIDALQAQIDILKANA
jgi:hypothetical protein